MKSNMNYIDGKLILKTDVVLRKKEYLNASLEKGFLVVKKEGEEVGRVEANSEIKKAFKNGRKPKVAVKDIVESVCELVLVRWADLHGHTEYSLLDGAVKVSDKAKKTEYASAITDHGNMFGFVAFYKAMEKENKHGIIGFEGYTETIDGEKTANHMIFLAKNEVGYRNVVKLTSLAYENFYRRPHISYEMLEEYSEGVIATSACLGGEISRHLQKSEYDEAKKVAKRLQSIFKDDFYLEIQKHNIGYIEDLVNEGLMKLSKELDIKLVATIDSHYLNREDGEVHEILLAMQTGKTMNDDSRMTFDGTGYHIHTADEVDLLFKDIPEALNNTLEIAEKCTFELKLGIINMPKFDIPEEGSADSYLRKMTEEGFEKRFEGFSEEEIEIRKERINFELNVIKEMNYSDYFLIVWDMIRFAKGRNIYVGPGRGSAVGSLVSYCLDIVDIDPIPYGLLFERFLNPERVSMPDIDIDFCYERRIEVADYVEKKYGSESVSKIVTINTLAAKSVVRAVVKALDLPGFIGNNIAKTIPAMPGMTLNKAYEESPEFKQMYDSDPQVKNIVDISRKLEGLPRNTSIHACGVLISNGRMDDFIPEFIVNRGEPDEQRVSQVVMGEAEDLGILKMDLLGLRTMTVLSETVKTVEEIDYDEIPLIDPYAYSEIGKGETEGVFQLESAGMRDFMSDLYSDVDKKIKKLERKYKVKGLYPPKIGKDGDLEGFIREMSIFGQELFERLIAGISLYRPGPMDFIPNYIKGMNNPKGIKYLTPELEPILEATYGVVVYQEQVIQIVQQLAGFSLGQADVLRRAMGKKIEGAMEIEKEKFINGVVDKKGNIIVPGCVRKGIKKEIGEEIWYQMEDFNKYAFNKSHSAGYAVISIKTAWLKTYYPVEFMKSTLNAYILNGDKAKSYLSTCRAMDITVLPPKINASEEGFSVVDDGIIFGLKAIRNIATMSERITRERTKGNFESLQDFAERMAQHEKIDKRVIGSLIYSGAVDEFEGTRSGKLEVVEEVLARAKKIGEDRNRGQVNMFDLFSNAEELNKISTPKTDEFAKRYMLDKEKEFTGYYLSGHPLDDYTDFFQEEDIVETDKLRVETEFDEETGEFNTLEAEYSSGDWVRLAGIITDKKMLYTKKDQKPMAVFEIEDRTGTIKCIVFPKQFEMNSLMLEEGSVVLIEGFYQNDDQGTQVSVQSVLDLERIAEANEHKDIKLVKARVIDESQVTALRVFISENPGNIPMYIYYKDQQFKSDTGMRLDVSTLLKLRNIVDSESLKLVS